MYDPRARNVVRGYLMAVEGPGERDSDVGQPENVELLWQAPFDAADGVRGQSMDEVVGDFEAEDVVLGRDADRGRGGEGGHETGGVTINI